jgi:CHRD domain
MRVLRSAIAMLAALAIVLTLTASSVSADGAQAHVYLLHLTGDQEATATCAPPTVCGDPDASAGMILLVLPGKDVVCFVTKWHDIDGTVVAAHIHPAPVGVAGPVAVPLFSGTFAGTDRANDCVSGAGWTDDIVANPAGFYVNIHSSVFQAGAVRAQLG